MLYRPELTEQEITENHSHFIERVALYKERSLDFLGTRKFILAKAQSLQGSILEIGSGTGYTTLALAEAGYKFTSIDKDRQALKTTALNLAYENLLSRVNFYIMDGESLTFAENSFRNVVIVNLFHHINNIGKVLLETDRVLCPNGKVILADFNSNGMEIVNSVHKQEGRIHEDSGANQDYVYTYLFGLGYVIESYEDRWHWLLIGEKKIQQ